ncbi:TPA: type III secretion system inner membrane ring lipoprotein SctJ [Salmonella enterica]|uniref:Lipoprotein n=1 Tax=Salmonella enterica TaxID=28901 RepID=A0A3V4IUC6_SALER|nr:type III secretion inner membrane ring lipoprotein SctJ [Salmonella enterica]ECC3553018.1 EscJ/YscJ/HrcJ family type III secretion inner membrane ring protein [Salmonella enterica subsp. salamae]HCM1851369.1 type III secretion inner membrane ring lipoprotein SctJ [Salmonella enterica subsp. salamae serovar 42:z29:-]AZT23122.1 EscJ/YscJ/HrcJ family type III secretion inner membrane ring protein [Salmonella enterica subsp. salamae serovar 42:r:-]AZT49518.1 EscJ/YscJ/HrcJ family type III secret
MKNKIKKMMILSILLLISGCNETLYSGLDENEANQMQALLLSNNINVSKENEKAGGISINVDKNDFVKAISILNNHGLPRKKHVNIEAIFPPSQLVSSPTQEHAKINYIKEQNVERLLSKIPGVIDCSIVLNINKEGDVPSSASVLIISSPEINLAPTINQIKSLVKNSIDDLKMENISVVIKNTAG